MMKCSSIFLLSVFFMWIFIPQVSAKHHCRSKTSFGLSFNVAPTPNYVVAPAPVYVQPAPPVYIQPAPGPVMYRSYVAEPVYPYYNAPMYVQPAPRAYVQPSFSYSYWRR